MGENYKAIERINTASTSVSLATPHPALYLKWLKFSRKKNWSCSIRRLPWIDTVSAQCISSQWQPVQRLIMHAVYSFNHFNQRTVLHHPRLQLLDKRGRAGWRRRKKKGGALATDNKDRVESNRLSTSTHLGLNADVMAKGDEKVGKTCPGLTSLAISAPSLGQPETISLSLMAYTIPAVIGHLVYQDLHTSCPNPHLLLWTPTTILAAQNKKQRWLSGSKDKVTWTCHWLGD